MVALFFGLSGFFAARPWERKLFEVQYLKPVNWIKFYWKRFARIIPVLWAFLLLMYVTDLFKGQQRSIELLLKNMVMIDANGHLWYIQNLIVIYMVEPALLLFSFCMRTFLKKLTVYNKQEQKSCSPRENVCGGVALIIIGAITEYLFRNVFAVRLHGNNLEQYLRIGLFIIGMGYGTIAKALTEFNVSSIVARAVMDLSELLILIAGAFTSPYYLIRFGMVSGKFSIGQKYPQYCVLVFGILFLLLMLNRDGLISKIFSWRPIRLIGEASFSMYLVQSFIIRATVKFSSNTTKWILVSVISAGIAYMSYELFEKPVYQRLLALSDKVFHKKPAM